MENKDIHPRKIVLTQGLRNILTIYDHSVSKDSLGTTTYVQSEELSVFIITELRAYAKFNLKDRPQYCEDNGGIKSKVLYIFRKQVSIKAIICSMK